MQFSSVLVAAAAFALANAAQFTMTASSFVGIKAGSAVNITWSGASGAVTLLLKNGPSDNLKTVETIASGLTGTSYSWTPESTLPSGTYAFEIDDSGSPNYSTQFTLAGSASASLSSSSASSTGSSTSSGSSTTSTGSSTSGSTTSSASTSSATRVSNSTSSAGSSTGSSTAKSTSSSGSKTGSSTGSSTSSTSSPSSLSGAANVASPLAFVLLAVAALMTLN